MALLLFVFGAAFGLLLLLNNLVKTIGRAEQIGFLDLLLTYLTALTLLAGVVVNNLGYFSEPFPPIELPGGLLLTLPSAPPDPFVELVTLLASGALAAFSLLLILLELFRPQRLKGSRGVFGLFSAGFIALSTFMVPFVGAFFAFDTPDSPPPVTAVADAAMPTLAPADASATPAAQARTAPDAAAEATEAINPETRARIVQLFAAIRQVISAQIDVPEAEVFAQLDAGVPLALTISARGGDVELLIRDLTEVMRGLIADSAERGEINRLQAALFSSQMGTFIRIAVNSDLTTLGQRFGAPTPDPSATRGSLLDLLTAFPSDATTPAPPSARASATLPATDTLIPTASPTPTPSATITPSITATRTPLPTATATPNRVATLQAELTLTLPLVVAETPGADSASETGDATLAPTRPPNAPFCIASVNYNLRLRAQPSRDSETLLVIPFTTVLELTARSSDSAWYATSFEGQSGWVDGEFLSLSASCLNLPFR